jgi:uncharacterized membrane-anchored protein
MEQTHGMILPASHPLRQKLNDEVHARPPEELNAPCSISYLALFTDQAAGKESGAKVRELAERFGAPPPIEGANHYSAGFGPFRLKWERHSEFTRYELIIGKDENPPFSDPPIRAVPQDWIASLPGRLLVATNIMVTRANAAVPNLDDISARYFGGNMLVGSLVSSGAARAITDFRIHGDGFSRILIQDLTLTPRQTGRVVQRLVEIDSYRMTALLALPFAQELAPLLTSWEGELVDITSAMVGSGEKEEPFLLDRLTKLEAEIESKRAASSYRFSAAAAYYDIVQRRIIELREERIQGLQTFQEFMQRRLEPAMSTCAASTARQEALSTGVARAMSMLSTKVDVTLEQQNQAVLASMDRRAMLQLRLQETVEGLSVAAITYYIVGLVGYAAKAAHAGGFEVNPELVMGISIPLVAGAVAYGLSRFRARIAAAESKH